MLTRSVPGRLVSTVVLSLVMGGCAPAAQPAAPTQAPAKPAAPAQPTTAPAAAPKPTEAPKPAAAAPAKPATLTKVELIGRGSFIGGHQSPYYVALEKKFFEDEGIEPNYNNAIGGSAALQYMAANPERTDIVGIIDVSAAALTISKGAALKSVAVIFQKSPVGIAYRKDRGINTFKDLEGKKVGFNPGGTEGVLIPIAFVANGVDGNKVQKVNLDGAAKDNALIAGQLDAISVYVNDNPIRIKGEGVETGSWPMADLGVPLMGPGLVANERTMQTKPEIVRGVTRAILRAWDYAKANPSEAIDILIKHEPDAKLNKAVALESLQATIPLTETDETKSKGIGYQSPTTWTKMIDLLGSDPGFGLEKKLPADQYFTNDFLPQR
jgi:NitT/TauT family transport system substrate-binding protein